MIGCEESQAAAGIQPRTLPEALDRHLRRGGVCRGIRLLDERGRAAFLAYSDLLVEADAVGRALDRVGLRPRERVMILLPTCRTLVTSILGCWRRGLVPFPGDPGGAWSRREDAPQQMVTLARQAGVRAIITAARRTAALTRQLGPGDPRVLSAESLRFAPAIGAGEHWARVQPEQAAVILSLSGTGGSPRPVVLSHGNLVQQLRTLGRALRLGEREILCGFAGLDSWIGLIDLLLLALYHGFDLVLLASEWVNSQPGRWIRALSDFRCTLTLAEDSAYGLCAHRLEHEELGPEIQLGCLRRAVAVGSTVRPGTQEAFRRRFSANGLSPNLFLTAYGLVEAGGIVTIGRPGAAVLGDRFDRRSLRPGQLVHTAGTAEARGRLMISSGLPLGGLELAIAPPAPGRHPTGPVIPEWREGLVGSILVRGSAVSQDSITDPDGWLDTGDLGFLMDGELFVVGRQGGELDLDGLRYDPEELEAVAGEVPGIRRGGVAAFTIGEEAGSRPVVVAASDRELGPTRREELAGQLGVRIGRTIGVRPQVVLVPGANLPRWGHGPAHRDDVRERYLELREEDEQEDDYSPSRLPS